MLLGVDGVCIISHGSSSQRAIFNGINVAREMVEGDVVGEISRAIRPPAADEPRRASPTAKTPTPADPAGRSGVATGTRIDTRRTVPSPNSASRPDCRSGSGATSWAGDPRVVRVDGDVTALNCTLLIAASWSTIASRSLRSIGTATTHSGPSNTVRTALSVGAGRRELDDQHRLGVVEVPLEHADVVQALTRPLVGRRRPPAGRGGAGDRPVAAGVGGGGEPETVGLGGRPRLDHGQRVRARVVGAAHVGRAPRGAAVGALGRDARPVEPDEVDALALRRVRLVDPEHAQLRRVVALLDHRHRRLVHGVVRRRGGVAAWWWRQVDGDRPEDRATGRAIDPEPDPDDPLGAVGASDHGASRFARDPTRCRRDGDPDAVLGGASRCAVAIGRERPSPDDDARSDHRPDRRQPSGSGVAASRSTTPHSAGRGS